MRIPEFILHSKKLDRNVAVKMPLALEVETYYIPFEPPVKPKKRTGDTSYALDSRMMFCKRRTPEDNNHQTQAGQ